MPYPTNFNTAIAVEDIIRNSGVTPATIAIMDGEIKVGLTQDELEYLATGNNILKVSERDIPFILAKN